SVAIALGIAMPEAGILPLSQGPDGDPAPRLTRQLREGVLATDVVVVGPGHKEEKTASRLAVALMELKSNATFVVDAAAICGLKPYRDRIRKTRRPWVMTPYQGELARLLGIEDTMVAARPAFH